MRSLSVSFVCALAIGVGIIAAETALANGPGTSSERSQLAGPERNSLIGSVVSFVTRGRFGSSQYACYGESRNLHLSRHPRTRGNVTGEGVTWCNLPVERMYVGSMLIKVDWWRGNQQIDFDQDERPWIDRKVPAQANPGDDCRDDGTYAISSIHYAWALDGTILSGSTYKSGRITC